MARTPRKPPATRWSIQSIYVRQRDGPARLEQAYLVLLGDPRDLSSSQPDHERSQNHARRDLRPGVHGTPGT